jgi:hypothetical protein
MQLQALTFVVGGVEAVGGKAVCTCHAVGRLRVEQPVECCLFVAQEVKLHLSAWQRKVEYFFAAGGGLKVRRHGAVVVFHDLEQGGEVGGVGRGTGEQVKGAPGGGEPVMGRG